MTAAGDSIWIRLMPATFVLLWSTGFIGAKFGLPYAEPFTILFYRMLLTLVFLGALILILKPLWPRSRKQVLHLGVTGLLVHGAYLGGVFYAIEAGMPAGLTALVVGLQPLLTGVTMVLLLDERLTGRVWLGLLLGLAGVILVLGGEAGAGFCRALRRFSAVGSSMCGGRALRNFHGNALSEALLWGHGSSHRYLYPVLRSSCPLWHSRRQF